MGARRPLHPPCLDRSFLPDLPGIHEFRVERDVDEEPLDFNLYVYIDGMRTELSFTVKRNALAFAKELTIAAHAVDWLDELKDAADDEAEAILRGAK